MRQKELKKEDSPFIEELWLELLLHLGDMQQWINSMGKDLLDKLPLSGKYKLRQQEYFLPIGVLAHILQRHYARPGEVKTTSCFQLPVPAIVALIRDAESQPAKPVRHSASLQRVFNAATPIGLDQEGRPTRTITVIISPRGDILTAFPGTIEM